MACQSYAAGSGDLIAISRLPIAQQYHDFIGSWRGVQQYLGLPNAGLDVGASGSIDTPYSSFQAVFAAIVSKLADYLCAGVKTNYSNAGGSVR